VKRSYGQSSRSHRQIFTPIRCVEIPVRAQVPVVDMSAKIEEAKAWLGDRWLLYCPKGKENA